MNAQSFLLPGAVALLLVGAPPALARQGQPAQPAAAAGAPAATDVAPLTDGELEQLLAPLALHPDSLLSQILMASTYPLEIVQADRWTKAHASLKGDALATELEKQTWDPSVKSLVNFPELLAGLSDKLDWTVKVGDAFLADQKRVLDAVQRLRARANDAGNLKTTQEQNVTVTPASGSQTQTIVIESSKPDVVYVPSYDTTVVYGGWPYPSYPPAPPPYYPPYYQPGAALVGFGVGLACGAAWGYAWGNCNWGGGDVDINVNRNNNFNNNIDRSKYQNRAGQTGSGKFQHDPAHRGGAAYRDTATANKFGGQTNARNNAARDQYRGRADQGRQDLGRGDGAGAGTRDAARGGAGASAGTREAGRGAGAGTREAGGGSRAGASGGASRSSPSAGSRQSSGGRGSAMSGADRGGGQTRAASSRGNASRSSAGMSRGGGGSRGGGRGGGRRG